MEIPHTLGTLSGWILPDGTWFPAEEWWHLTALYELLENNNSALQDTNIIEALRTGDEDKIRISVAQQGFIKIARKQIDGCYLGALQLQTLKNLLLYCNPEDEMNILCMLSARQRSLKIGRILKLKNSAAVFYWEEPQSLKYGS